MAKLKHYKKDDWLLMYCSMFIWVLILGCVITIILKRNWILYLIIPIDFVISFVFAFNHIEYKYINPDDVTPKKDVLTELSDDKIFILDIKPWEVDKYG